MLPETETIKNSWNRYHIEVLYNKDKKQNEVDFHLEEESTFEPDALWLDLLDSEVASAIKYMKNNKA